MESNGAAFQATSMVDKENSCPSSVCQPKVQGTKCFQTKQSPAKMPLSSIGNRILQSPKGKSLTYAEVHKDAVDSKRTPTKSACTVDDKLLSPVVKPPSKLWLERSIAHPTALDCATSEKVVRAQLPEIMTAPLAITEYFKPQLAPSVSTAVQPEALTNEGTGLDAFSIEIQTAPCASENADAEHSLADALTYSSLPSSLSMPGKCFSSDASIALACSIDELHMASRDESAELSAIPTPDNAPKQQRTLSSPLSPYAKPFYPRTNSASWTLFSPKAKPLANKSRPLASSSMATGSELLSSPAKVTLQSTCCLESPNVAPLRQPSVLASPFTPGLASERTLSKRFSSSILAPTFQQAKAKEMSILEALWIRRTTPVKSGRNPSSPCGNVLTSPETWSATNWWSPSNRPMRNLAVQADLLHRTSTEESIGRPKKLFSDADMMTDFSIRSISSVSTETDFDFPRVESWDTEAVAAMQQFASRISSLSICPTSRRRPCKKLSQLKRKRPMEGRRMRPVLRLVRRPKSNAPAVELFAKRVQKQAVVRQASLKRLGSMYLDTVQPSRFQTQGFAAAEAVFAPFLQVKGEVDQERRCSLNCAGDVGTSLSSSMSMASSAQPSSSATAATAQKQIVSCPVTSPQAGTGRRIVIHLPSPMPEGQALPVNQKEHSDGSVHIVTEGVTIDVYP